jgi:transposase-like protein
MPRTRPPYPPELRRRLVELVRAGQTPEELARKFEPSAGAIRNWVVQAARDEGRRAVSTVAQREPPGVAHMEPVWRRDRTPFIQVAFVPLGFSCRRGRGGR